MKNWSVFALMIFVFAACKSLKPASSASNTKTSATSSKSSSPRFIENISVKPSGNNASVKEDKLTANSETKTGYNNASASSIENLSSLQFKYGVLMNIPVEDISNLTLWGFIDDWYGTRYRYGGSTKDGIDCSGFACTLMNAVFGFQLPRTSKEQYQQCDKLEKSSLQEGDLVFFNTSGGVSHVGVYLANNKFVHASTSSGVMISDLNEAYYAKRFLGGGRMKSK